MKKVLVIQSMHEAGMDLLRGRPDVEMELIENLPVEAVRERIADVHGIAVRTMVLTEDLLKDAPHLEVVSRHGVGCDSVPVDYLTTRGIPVAIAAGANSRAVAEHVMMMMLNLAKRAAFFDTATRKIDWTVRSKPTTWELEGKTVLIIGFGRIGRLLAPLCRAFGMRVLLCDIALDETLADSMGCERADDYRAALGEADFVSLHVPLDASTRGMIGAEELRLMKPNSLLINCARGGMVDEIALAEALKNGQIAGAGLDVFEHEPVDPDNPLLTLPNVVMSPHSAAMTHEGARLMAEMTAQNILDCFEGKLTADRMFNPQILDKDAG